jgi:type IV secretion system protein VirB10
MNAREPNGGLAPLEGEPGIPSVHAPRRGAVAVKAVIAVVVVVLGLGFAVYATITRFVSSGTTASAEDRRAPKAAATVSTGRVFDPSKPPVLEGDPTSGAAAPLVPAIEPESDADPIGMRASSVDDGRAPKRSPYDAPAMLGLISASDTRGEAVQTATPATDERHESLRRAQESLDEYQQNLKGMLGNLQRVAANAGTNPAASAPPAAALQNAAQSAAALGGQLNVGSTPRVAATHLGDRSLTLPKGTTFTCALKTKIVSEQSGYVSCQVLRHVYSDDGRVLLVDRGSHLDGEYSARIRNGQARIFVVWSRLRTPAGVTVDIGSPATGPLGEAGVDGYVDNHWGQRIGAALLLSLIEDGMKIAAAEAASSDRGTSIVLSDQADTTSSLAEKVLDSTINIPPTISKLQGEVVGIYVARDVDFSPVYELRTAAR